MLTPKQNLELTPDQVALIADALHTKEKILTLQSRATEGSASHSKLSELRVLLQRLQPRARPSKPPSAGWTGMARSLLGLTA